MLWRRFLGKVGRVFEDFFFCVGSVGEACGLHLECFNCHANKSILNRVEYSHPCRIRRILYSEQIFVDSARVASTDC